MTVPTAGPFQRFEGLHRKKAVDRLFTNFGRGATLLGTGLALLFAWVKLQNLPVPPLQDADPLQMLHFFLALGFASYMAAVSFEVGIHRSVYVDDPLQGRLTPDIIGCMILMAAGAAFLFWASYREAYFPFAVLFFVFTDFLLWRQTLRRFIAVIHASRAFYEKHELFELEKLSVLERHVGGLWRWYRFALTLGGVAVLFFACFAVQPRGAIAASLNTHFPALSDKAASALIPVVVFGALLAVLELWVWIVRFQMFTSLAVIEDLRRRYELALRDTP